MSKLILPDNEIHVYLADIPAFEGLIPAFQKILSPEELARAARYRFEKDRVRQTVNYGVLRTLAGRYLDIRPEDIVFGKSAHDKPFITNPGRGGFQFNLSHSGLKIAYAFTRGREVGIDIEQICNKATAPEIMNRFFSAAEIEEYRNTPKHLQQRAFFAGWCRKEALIKATGEGLRRALNSFTVVMNPDTREFQINLPMNGYSGEWQICSLSQGLPGYECALAFESSEILVMSRSLTPADLGL